jgi:hypothetical protein
VLAALNATAAPLHLNLDPQDPQIPPATIASTFQRWAAAPTKANAALVSADPFLIITAKKLLTPLQTSRFQRSTNGANS